MNQLTFPLQRNNSVRNVDPINSKSKIRIEPMIVVFNSPVRFSIIIVRYYLYYKIHFILIHIVANIESLLSNFKSRDTVLPLEWLADKVVFSSVLSFMSLSVF